MTWQEALEVVSSRTRSDAFRERCHDPDPAVSGPFREIVVRMATGATAGEKYPSMVAMAANVLKAAAAALADGFRTVDEAERARRLAICAVCPHFDATQERCYKCGCVSRWKAALASQHCPDNPPRW
jgi:hypothetical protein